jgi:hypothetical protein
MKTFIQNTLEKIQRVPLHYWILGVILIVGIFLRTYEFRDWMVFNPDQARDALLVQDMIDGTTWPLMGPQAGSTFFKLGPIFYYFEYASAWLFGASAVHMAYPDLLFSLLTIIVGYFFFREFFEKNIALVTTFLFSISFFVVTYSRFAFNPNSSPFFVILFLLSLLKIMEYAPREKFGWAIVAGSAVGVGIQLHTILFISMPLLMLCIGIYFIINKQFIWKSALVIILFFLLFNTVQLVADANNHWSNLHSFFSQAQKNTAGKEINYFRSGIDDTLCHLQATTYIISSLGGGDKCELTNIVSRIETKGWFFNAEKLALIFFGGVFTIGGWSLLCWYFRKNMDMNQKRAFGLMALYSVITFFVLLPISSDPSIRYFIVIEFIPFVLLGLWFRFMFDIFNRQFAIFGITVVSLLLIVLNGWTIGIAAKAFSQGSASTNDFAIYGEVQSMSQYILNHSVAAHVIFLAGRDDYLSRFDDPLNYFMLKEGKVIRDAYHKEDISPQDAFFYITKKDAERIRSTEVIKGFVTEDAATFGNVTIIKLIRKP